MGSRQSSGTFRAVRSVAAVSAVLLVGCSGSDPGPVGAAGTGQPTDDTTEASAEEAGLPTPVQALDIVGDEYSFVVSPDPAAGLRPGWTEVRFDNTGDEPHQVMFARIKDGVDMAELAAAGAGDSSGAAAIEFVDMIGGVSYIDAGHDTTALVYLPEGTVMAMCYVPDANGIAHALMGMSTMLEVSASAPEPAAVAERPSGEVVGRIEMAADGYRFPAAMRPGWYRVDNTDEALHEVSLLRLERAVDGAELETMVAELAANVVPDVALEAVGGMGALSAGFEGYLHLDLEPGEYLAVDFMPDPGDPRPHMLDGYYGRLTVAG